MSTQRRGRRRFLALTLGLGFLALARPRRGASGESGRRHRRAAHSMLVDLLREKESARVIGAEYLKCAANEACPQVLLRLIASGLDDGRDLHAVDLRTLRRLFRERTRRDFEEGRTVRLRGWILSVAEARLCALTTFV